MSADDESVATWLGESGIQHRQVDFNPLAALTPCFNPALFSEKVKELFIFIHHNHSTNSLQAKVICWKENMLT